MFPQAPRLALLLDHALRGGDGEALAAMVVTLQAMGHGGIQDQVGGGFHRYATDNAWLVPHFEKMLYTQAQLARLYLNAVPLTGDAELARVARRTLGFVLRDLSSPAGGGHRRRQRGGGRSVLRLEARGTQGGPRA